jgi:predicted protein tyrosine phosphatase
MRIRISDIDSVSGLMNHSTHVISLVDTRGGTRRLPKAAFNNENWLVCEMDDIEQDIEDPRCRAPQLEDLEKILAFTSKLGKDDILLVHCHAGLCRSTAVAFLIMLQQGMNFEDAMAEVLRQREFAWPNIRIVLLGDKVLGLAGRAVHFMHNWHASNITPIGLDHLFT